MPFSIARASPRKVPLNAIPKIIIGYSSNFTLRLDYTWDFSSYNAYTSLNFEGSHMVVDATATNANVIIATSNDMRQCLITHPYGYKVCLSWSQYLIIPDGGGGYNASIWAHFIRKGA